MKNRRLSILSLVINNKKEKVFLLKNKSVILKENIKTEIILSSEFYWIRYFDAPELSASEAKKLAQSFFEDILPKEIKYTYQTIKVKGKGYLYFAYDKQQLISHLEGLNIDLNLINNIYFAHNECLEYDSFIYDDVGFKYINNILVKVPQEMINENFVNITNKIDNISLSKYSLKISFYENIISTKTLQFMFTFLIILNILVFWKSNMITNQIDTNHTEITYIKEHSTLPSSMIQTKSIVKGFQVRIKKQQKIRAIMKNFLEYKKRDKKIIIEEIKYQNNQITFLLQNINKKKFTDYLKSKKYSVLQKQIKKTIIVEVKI